LNYTRELPGHPEFYNRTDQLVTARTGLDHNRPPPDTSRTCPLTNEASSLARKRMQLATSSGCPTRPSG